MTPIYVHTLGDSTLDNCYWTINEDGSNAEQAKETSVEGQLQSTLGAQYKVESRAYDGFTTKSVLGMDEVGRVFTKKGERLDAYIQAKLGSTLAERSIRPLDMLTTDISKQKYAVHYVVISVGGNDFRENLLNPLKLLRDVPQIQKRYLDIVDRVKKIEGDIRPILMFQYRTDARAGKDPYRIYTILKIAGGLAVTLQTGCLLTIAALGAALGRGKIAGFAGGIFMTLAATLFVASRSIVPLRVTVGILKGQDAGMAMIGGLMEKFYKPILEKAQKGNIPILDLPNSFNPYEHEPLYISGIEPSERGGYLIANGLSHIITYHDYNSSGKIYTCDGDEKQIFPSQWRVKYPSKPRN
jgi:hypothetical protein